MNLGGVVHNPQQPYEEFKKIPRGEVALGYTVDITSVSRLSFPSRRKSGHEDTDCDPIEVVW